ncbi:MAG: hypothetical protein L3J76_02585, partial [Candidatus Hydrothermae bacterium]|nr:hypothetical protein [Candidatus Hydrothermae bacterium]
PTGDPEHMLKQVEKALSTAEIHSQEVLEEAQESLRKALADLDADRRVLHEDLRDVARRVKKELPEDLSDQEETVHRALRNHLAKVRQDAQKRFLALNQQIKTYEDTLRTTRETLQKLQGKEESLKAQYRELEERVQKQEATLRQRLEEAKHHRDEKDLKRSRADTAEHYADWKRAVEAWDREKAQLQGQWKGMHAEWETQRRTVQELDVQLPAWVDLPASLPEGELAPLIALLRTLQQQVRERRDHLTQEVETLTHHIQGMQEDVGKLQAQAEQLKKILEQLQGIRERWKQTGEVFALVELLYEALGLGSGKKTPAALLGGCALSPRHSAPCRCPVAALLRRTVSVRGRGKHSGRFAGSEGTGHLYRCGPGSASSERR